jgi:hypothetical protein
MRNRRCVVAVFGATFRASAKKYPLPIKSDTTYRFLKCGNLVRVAAATIYGNRGNWVVARIDSDKEMIVPGRTSIDPNHPDWS